MSAGCCTAESEPSAVEASINNTYIRNVSYYTYYEGDITKARVHNFIHGAKQNSVFDRLIFVRVLVYRLIYAFVL